MLASQVQQGETYSMRLRGRMVPVRVISRVELVQYGDTGPERVAGWAVVDTQTGKRILVRRADRFRSVWSEPRPPHMVRKPSQREPLPVDDDVREANRLSYEVSELRMAMLEAGASLSDVAHAVRQRQAELRGKASSAKVARMAGLA